MTSRNPPDWMGQVDERILERISEVDDDDYTSPSELAEAIGSNPDYISRRTSKMKRAGFVKVFAPGSYVGVTDEGAALLAGGDFSDVPDPDEDD